MYIVIDPSLLVGNIGLEIGLLYQGNSCINTSIYFLVKIVKIISPNQSQTPALSSCGKLPLPPQDPSTSVVEGD